MLEYSESIFMDSIEILGYDDSCENGSWSFELYCSNFDNKKIKKSRLVNQKLKEFNSKKWDGDALFYVSMDKDDNIKVDENVGFYITENGEEKLVKVIYKLSQNIIDEIQKKCLRFMKTCEEII